MGIATNPLPAVTSLSKGHHLVQLSDKPDYLNSMSQDYPQDIFSFSNGFGRSQQQQLVAQQIRRDKLRVEGFQVPPPLVAIGEEGPGGLSNPTYEAGGMLSEMFNFQSGATTATELLQNQIQANYRASRPPPAARGANDWYGDRQLMVDGVMGPSDDSKNHDVISAHDSITAHHQQFSSINADSAAAMQLFLMNPQRRSPSPQPTHHPPATTSTLHMLLPNPSSTSTLQGFHTTTPTGAAPFGPSQFTWVPDGGHQGGSTAAQLNNPSEIGGFVEGQALSLSLSSSLQNLEAAKAEELRIGDSGMLFFNQGASASASAQHPYKYLGGHHQLMHLQCGLGQNQQVHAGFCSSLGMVNVLRNSKYTKAAQELLEEFCSVGRGHFKKNKFGRNNTNPNSNPSGSAGGGGDCSSSSSKDLHPLSAADRLEHQRRKVKLLSMLDEVDRRYNHYCEQMQMVVNSFDLVMGFGAAVPYTALAQKAMSRHFRCLKDAVAAQLKHSCMLLGEKDASTSGVTKGETPRLRLLEQSLRQQRAFHHIGIMEQEAWRPQRGLPERSVNTLRAWLFEHFLHPYPSDADKHLLARQTGLSRNQVSNWFINARVRLWKPMVEEMYQQEAKDETDERESNQNTISAQTPTPAGTTATTPATTATGKRSEINVPESDPSLIAISNRQCFSETESQAKQSIGPSTMSNTIMPTTSPISAVVTHAATAMAPPGSQSFPTTLECHTRHGGSMAAADFGTTTTNTVGNADMGSKLVRFGTAAGDVSLTLGLRHSGNLPEKSPFFS